MRFQPPTETEATAYAWSLGYKTFDYNVWAAYYEQRGWCPKGSAKQMASWQAAVRTWFYRTDEYKELQRQRNQPESKPVIKQVPNVKVATEQELKELEELKAKVFGKVIKPLETEEELERRCNENRNRIFKELYKEN